MWFDIKYHGFKLVSQLVNLTGKMIISKKLVFLLELIAPNTRQLVTSAISKEERSSQLNRY